MDIAPIGAPPRPEPPLIGAEAAEQPAARSGTVEAAAGYEAAARLSPDPERRARRLLRAGQLWFMAGRVDAALAVAEEVLAATAPHTGGPQQAADGSGPIRAQAALLRGRALLVGSSEAEGRRYLAEEADRASPADRTTALSMLLAASASALRAGDVAQALRLATIARDRAVDTDEETRAQAEVSWLTARVASGDLGCRRALTDAALAVVAAGIRSETPLVTINAGLALIWAGDHDGARRLIDKQEQLARTAPAPGALPAILTTRALLEHRTCRWRVAEVVAVEALQLAGQTGQRAMAPYAEAVLATVEAILGRAEQCRARCLSLLEGPARDLAVLRAAALSALGLLELGEGRPAEAVRRFEVLAGSGASQASTNPGIVMWGADLAEAYIRSGQPEKAAVVVGQLEELTSGTGDARVAAGAKRCRAMLAADDADAEVLFAEALRHYGGAEWAFARARTELARGERLVRSGRVADGRARLERARATFSELGAGGWTAQAEQQLAALAPGAAIGQLTALELQVAGAAAFGGTPADIAAGLFLPEATVAGNLSAAMVKLGVSAPAELGNVPGLLAALSAPGPRPEADQTAVNGGGDCPAPVVLVRLLGTYEIESGAEPLEAPAGVVGQALKHVALAGRVPIEELVEELWPDAPPGAGRTRFRSVLNRMRRGAGSLVVRDGDWVSIAPGVEVDVSRFEEAAAAAQAAWSAADGRAGAMIRRALDLYGGELLPTDRHLSFTTGPRERLRRRYLAVLGLAVEEAARRSDVEAAVRLLESAIAADPHEETLYLKAASILVDAGRRSEAASVLRRARAMLDDLGLPLSQKGMDLERSLRTVD